MYNSGTFGVLHNESRHQGMQQIWKLDNSEQN